MWSVMQNNFIQSRLVIPNEVYKCTITVLPKQHNYCILGRHRTVVVPRCMHESAIRWAHLAQLVDDEMRLLLLTQRLKKRRVLFDLTQAFPREVDASPDTPVRRLREQRQAYLSK